MKLLLSLLVVANVLLFGWFRGWMSPFGGDGRDPGRLERQVEPERLRIVPGPRAGPGPAGGDARAGAADPAATSGAPVIASPPPVPPAPPPSPPSPAALGVVLRAAGCAEIGPMSEQDAVRVQVMLDAVVQDLVVTTQRAEDITSWWVYVAPSSGDVARRVADLRERGVSDLYVMPDGQWKGAISFGLFRQEELAVALQKTIAQKGVRNVRVAPRGPSAGRITLQVRPIGDALIAELPKLRTAMPEAIARPCASRG
ncbi:MAG: hypothetical protein ACK5PW_19835 [Burkholderiales bacterium]|jgi:hypothetical protein